MLIVISSISIYIKFKCKGVFGYLKVLKQQVNKLRIGLRVVKYIETYGKTGKNRTDLNRLT